MSVWIPDARFEMPELLVPGKQPTGKVRVDYTHPLSRDLRAAYLPSYDPNTVTNSAICSHSGSTTISTKPQGRTKFYTSNAANVTTSSVVTNASYKYPNTLGYTVLMGFVVDNIVASSMNFATDGANKWSLNASGAAGVAPNQTITLRTTFGGIADYATTTVSGINTGVVMGASVTYGASSYIYKGDGFGNAFTVGTPGAGGNTVFFFANTQGEFFWAYYWSRALSEDECDQIRRNPYQFLIPA